MTYLREYSICSKLQGLALLAEAESPVPDRSLWQADWQVMTDRDKAPFWNDLRVPRIQGKTEGIETGQAD
jgi:hypothetical protein